VSPHRSGPLPSGPSEPCGRSGPDARSEPNPAFATDHATWDYYEQRAGEYDEWYTGAGQYAIRDRPGWSADVDAVVAVVRGLPPVPVGRPGRAGRTLDVACGTGFLGRHLAGDVVGMDRSLSMAAIARDRLAGGRALVADALALPFASGSFDRVSTGHFYGHLPPQERRRFLGEVRRVATSLVVIDSARRDGVPAEGWQDRMLNDGSRHRVYKRYFSGTDLAAEISGRCLHAGPYFVVAVADL
jgi:demethylmenaquinone methyltransferase/2-methoxy-6-polyprenyl-1,4-benzoquinol methylase